MAPASVPLLPHCPSHGGGANGSRGRSDASGEGRGARRGYSRRRPCASQQPRPAARWCGRRGEIEEMAGYAPLRSVHALGIAYPSRWPTTPIKTPARSRQNASALVVSARSDALRLARPQRPRPPRREEKATQLSEAADGGDGLRQAAAAGPRGRRGRWGRRRRSCTTTLAATIPCFVTLWRDRVVCGKYFSKYSGTPSLGCFQLTWVVSKLDLNLRLKLARAYLPGRTYGFVEFANPQDANAVRNDLDGQEMFGRRIIVKFASEHEMYQYNNHYSHDDRYNHGQQSRETKLSVYNISPHIQERDFEDLFGRYGRVRKADLKGNSGFVEYYDPRDAHEAKRKLDMQNIDGRHISVEFKTVEQHCKNCGKNGHVPADCEATYWKGRCYCCGEKGHLKRNCRNRPKDLRQRRSYSRSPSPRYSRGQSRHYRRSRSRSYSGSPSSKRSNRNTRGE
ncbi:hypothetical protein BS78_09G062800 [Paspalum vaginatum]|nr:hypothetical protein BS78_09G062800 [Paspalum vaginatum]